MSDTTIKRPIAWSSSADTNVGLVREYNEDAILSLDETGLWVVADGMGGYEAGDVASNLIVKTLSTIEPDESLDAIVTKIEETLIDVNHQILEYADIMLDGRTSGSTVVCLLLKGRVGVCLWAGDSRLYRHRSGELLQLSRDHSQVEELVQQGFISPEDAATHPNSSVITRAIGACADIYIDINVFSVQIGDTFLLCSDGLYNMVDHDTILQHMAINDSSLCRESLIAEALANGATDNVSVIVVKCTPGSVKLTRVAEDQITDDV